MAHIPTMGRGLPNPGASGPSGHAKMGGMSELATTDPGAVATSRVRILVYSDDVHAREKVRFAVGPTIADRQVRWTEAATEDAVFAEMADRDFDLLILDGEAAKVGGMGICHQLKHELYHCPPVLLLVGRRDDAWIATWSLADAAVAHPLDPFEVRAAVEEFFAPSAAR